MIVGKKIKEFRLKKNMTQEQLAAELNVSYQAVSKWERSATTPDISLIPLIAEKLGASCDALLTDGGIFSNEEIERIIRHARPEEGESETADQYAKRLRELEEAYEKYPRSFPLMHALAQKYSQGARRIRMYIWKQWKKPKARVGNLMKLSMPKWKAYRNGNSRKGYWAVAGSGILTHTVTNERLAQAGYCSILAMYESLH